MNINKNRKPWVNIVGGGLAGSEAAYQLALRGIPVRLFEMRPAKLTPAHKSGGLAELVCSNSFKSLSAHSAHAGFKQELALMGSLLMKASAAAKVPAGESLAVDREIFSKTVEEHILSTGLVEKISQEVHNPQDLPEAHCTLLATGPLTQGGLFDYLKNFSANEGLYFYDAIAPVISADSVDRNIAFSASRYGKGSDDFLNCPMDENEYNRFIDALLAAEKVELHAFEEPKYFQGCQPIETIAATGRDSLRFGPMKPVGLTDPRNGRRPHAVIQLRIDNLSHSAYNMVGFQTKLKYGEQSKVFRLIPGLENAEFLRLGSIHRNTYICSPELLNENFSLKTNPAIRFAGQITGVEGYTESSGIGLLAALAIVAEIEGKPWSLPPKNTFSGALCHYLFHSPAKDFQPLNVHFGLFSEDDFALPGKNPQGKRWDKQEKRALLVQKGVENFKQWHSISMKTIEN